MVTTDGLRVVSSIASAGDQHFEGIVSNSVNVQNAVVRIAVANIVWECFQLAQSEEAACEIDAFRLERASSHPLVCSDVTLGGLTKKIRRAGELQDEDLSLNATVRVAAAAKVWRTQRKHS